MKSKLILSILFFLNLGLIAQNKSYLGFDVPKDSAIVFAPNVISHGFHELGLRISPELNEYMYVTSDSEYITYRLVQVKKIGNEWKQPELAVFANHLSVMSLSYSFDGNKLALYAYEISDSTKTRKIYLCDYKNDNWSAPKELKYNNPDNLTISHPSFGSDESIYCCVRTEEKEGIYIMYKTFDGYSQPKLVSELFKGLFYRPYVNLDESIILFHANLEEGIGLNDLYISFKDDNMIWSKPVLLSNIVNSQDIEFGPYLSPDGKYFFFSSYRPVSNKTFITSSYKELMNTYRNPQNGYATLFWIKSDFIEKLKRNTLNK